MLPCRHLFQLLVAGCLCATLPLPLSAHEDHAHEPWQPTPYPQNEIHAPTPLPDRVVLTWSDDPATTQSVTWRTDTSVPRGVAEIAVANANGRALEPERFEAVTELFQSDLNQAHYHTLTFRNLQPETLYAYRVGDGVNWSEFFHFRTAAAGGQDFSFIYFGDAQNEIKTHWSRVCREAFRDAPRAAFTLHAGDLINSHPFDSEWGEWHRAPGWVNGTIPVIATPGNHEYYRAGRGPREERFWKNRDGDLMAVDLVDQARAEREDGSVQYELRVRGPEGGIAGLTIQDGKILQVDAGLEAMTGFVAAELVGTGLSDPPLSDRRRAEGTPTVSGHWRPQFHFPVQGVPAGLEETVYYIDYQGTRVICLDSNQQQEIQVEWLRGVLTDNPNRWTILTFHHPIFSPAKDRDNVELRALWKPIIDEFKVDLVLNGHDHTYARTGELGGAGDEQNTPTGYQQAYDPDIGTVYVVSVSGPKMYAITKGQFARRTAENTQLYQVIEVRETTLSFRAYKATGELYDAFTLEKREGRANRLIEDMPD